MQAATKIPAPARFRVTGIEPSSVRAAAPADRLAYWRAVVAFGVEAKERELARGLDRRGKDLAPLSPKTIAQRKSAMGPADPRAPALQPAHGLSRTRSLFTGEATPDGCWFGWLVDPHTGEPWGNMLLIHRKGGKHLPKRDVVGLSPASLHDVTRKAAAWWVEYQAGRASTPEPDRPTYPGGKPKFLVGNVPRYTPRNPANAAPKSNARISQVEINGQAYILQSGSAAQTRRMIASGRYSGPRSRAERAAERVRLGLPPQGTTPTAPPRPPSPPARPERPDVARKPTRRKGPLDVPAFPASNATVAPGGALATHRAADVRRAIAGVLGPETTSQRLASLVGAPDDAVVEVMGAPGSSFVRYSVKHPAFDAFHGTFEKTPEGRVVHKIDRLDVVPERQARGYGARVHGRQVYWGGKHGLDRLTVVASRADNDVGFSVWPRFGYDGPIPESIRRTMPEDLRRFATLRDLLDDPEGRRWWLVNGDTIKLAFDLKPGSQDRMRWNLYWTRTPRNPIDNPR